MGTAGFTDADGCALIDHVAATKDLCVSVKSIPPKREENGLKLSDHAGLVLDIVLSNEQHFPSRDIRDLMTAAALRFNGDAYAERRSENGDVFDVLSKLAEQVVETQQPLVNDLENFAAFFAHQRFLCKWGGDRLTWESPEWHAFARPFTHLKNIETPPDYLDAERETKWKLVSSDSENAVALLRKKLE